MVGQSSPGDPVVVIVDDDALLRDALARLFRSVGLNTLLFGSAAELLKTRLPDVPSCLVLDVRLPGLSGLDIQGALSDSGLGIPVVFMTGHGDIPMTVQAMKAGAVDFLTKPFRDQDMLDAVNTAIEHDRKRRAVQRSASALNEIYGRLSPREKEVMALVTAGLMNKQAADEMGLSEITVKIHRGNMMRKMGAKSLAELVLMAQALGLTATRR